MRKTFFILLILFVAGSLVYFYGFQDKTPAEKKISVSDSDIVKPLIVILSPHFDDGVLSLGGFMAKREQELLVATFFTQRPTEILHTNWDKISGFSNSDDAIFSRTKENENALAPFNTIIKNYDYPDFQYRKRNQDKEIRNGITKDIQSIVETYENREIFIYGPAIFGEKITHPDHKIVHDAFMDFFRTNKKTNLHFFIYEDFLYIRQFMNTSLGNFNDFLNKQENIISKENSVELDKSELDEKISSIYAYPSQVKAFISLGDDLGIIADKFFQSRCKITYPDFYACEVVHSFSN
jgi:LmbE family N-acetylglucosaminyl deacetylase